MWCNLHHTVGSCNLFFSAWPFSPFSSPAAASLAAFLASDARIPFDTAIGPSAGGRAGDAFPAGGVRAREGGASGFWPRGVGHRERSAPDAWPDRFGPNYLCYFLTHISVQSLGHSGQAPVLGVDHTEPPFPPKKYLFRPKSSWPI